MLDQEKELKRIIEVEDPILFLGAGFSLGAKTHSGRNIPTGNQLKSDIITELLRYTKESKEFTDLDKYNLSEVCDFCESERSKAHLTDYLVEYFKNSKPAIFHDLITSYPWKKIYTTNIDDIVEVCYKDTNQELLIQNFKRRSTISEKGKIEFLKLHGCVNNPSEGLTFSNKSYLDTMILSKDYRFNSLSLDMHSESIIFIGHDFNEFNIDFYLKLYENSGYQSSKGKLIFINPYPSIIFKSKIKQIGALLIEWDTESFFQFVSTIRNNTNDSAIVNQLRSLTRFGFESFKTVRSKILPIKKYESNLYFGFEPNWFDVFDEWDFQNNDLIESVSQFCDISKNEESRIFAIYGKGLSGKSTFLLRAGIELDLLGYEVWDFRGKHFNYYELFKWTKLNPERKKFALLYDNASYNYRDILRLVKLIHHSQHLIVVTTSRLPSHLKSRYNIVDAFHKEYFLEPKISKEFALEIAQKLNTKGYLGSLKKFDDIYDRVKFITDKNDLLNILYEITFGKGFRTRISGSLFPLLKNDSDERDLLIILALFEKLDLPSVPKELISLLLGSNSKAALHNIEDFIKYTSTGDVSLRTVFYLESILKTCSVGKVVALVKNILLSIAPQINDRHSSWTQIEAAFTNEKLLRKRFGIKTKEIKEMLYDLKLDLSGSYNFWIQLGITEQAEGEYDKALNHFKQAEVINPGSYMVKNAIGRNYLKQANSLNNINLARTIFAEGETILLRLIAKREELEVRAFSTHTYLYEKIIFLKKFEITPPNDEIREMFSLLKRLMDKDPEDVMSKQISNYFYDFLRSIKRSNVIKLNYHDLKLLNSMLSESRTDLVDLVDD